MALKQPKVSQFKLKRNDLKWQNKPRERLQDTSKGTKPLPDPITLQQMMVVLLMHMCRKVLLMNTEYKIGLYGIVLLFGSVLCDFFPLPKTYMSRKDNVLNKYFAKVCLGWTLMLVGAFMWFTSNVYCCGNKTRIRSHFYRLIMATVCWYVMTTLFVFIESVSGFCLGSSQVLDIDRSACLKQGFRWRGFDISGHTFLLMYCSLIIHEETKAIKGWDRIKDLIRDVEYDEDSPLKTLSSNELDCLKIYSSKFDSYVKGTFVALTGLSLLWDFILTCTILYFHSMVQKVVGGIIAILLWYATYRFLYIQDWSTGLPGHGLFKYADVKSSSCLLENRRKSLVSQKFN